MLRNPVEGEPPSESLEAKMPFLSDEASTDEVVEAAHWLQRGGTVPPGLHFQKPHSLVEASKQVKPREFAPTGVVFDRTNPGLGSAK